MTISLQREIEFCVTLQWAGINTQMYTAGIDFSTPMSLIYIEQWLMLSSIHPSNATNHPELKDGWLDEMKGLFSF